MIRRQPYSEAPDAVKQLVAELEKNGDYLVYEDGHQQPIVSIVPAKARRVEGARKLRQMSAETPPSSLSEDKMLALINEAVDATKGQYPEDAKVQTTPR